MKIAVFSDCYLDLTGGIIQVINAERAELEKRGHEVYVFSTGFPRKTGVRQKLARENIFLVPSCRWFFRGLTPVSRRPGIIEKWLLKEHPELKDFDVFYVHYEAGCSIAGMRLARRLGIPVVQMMHGREDMGVATVIPRGLRTVVAGALNWFHSWYLPHSVRVNRDDYLAPTRAAAWMWTAMVNHANYADAVITPSRHFREKLEHYGVTRPITVIPNGYPDEKFRPSMEVRKLAPGETLRMIWHSRVQGEKRIMPFLEALRLLSVKNDKNGTKFTLDVYGGGTELGRARRYVARWKLPVKFHGDVKFDVVQQAILKAHLDVVASYNYDTFGMTLIEAEVAGVGAFFCDPDMQEVVPHGGYVLAKGPSAAEMAEALGELLAHPERIEEMSAVMIKHRSEVLTSRQADKLVKVLQGAGKGDIMKK